MSLTNRGDAAAATWIFRGDESRRRRGRDVDIPWRQSHGDAAAATRTFGLDRGAPSRYKVTSLPAEVQSPDGEKINFWMNTEGQLVVDFAYSEHRGTIWYERRTGPKPKKASPTHDHAESASLHACNAELRVYQRELDDALRAIRDARNENERSGSNAVLVALATFIIGYYVGRSKKDRRARTTSTGTSATDRFKDAVLKGRKDLLWNVDDPVVVLQVDDPVDATPAD